jgi:hypothetical protein
MEYSKNNKAIKKKEKHISLPSIVVHLWTITVHIPGVKKKKAHCLMLFQLNFFILPLVEGIDKMNMCTWIEHRDYRLIVSFVVHMYVKWVQWVMTRVFKSDIEINHSLSFIFNMFVTVDWTFHFLLFQKSHQNEFSQMTIKTNRATFLHDFKKKRSDFAKKIVFLVIKRLYIYIYDWQTSTHIFFSMNRSIDRSAMENNAFSSIYLSICLSVCLLSSITFPVVINEEHCMMPTMFK